MKLPKSISPCPIHEAVAEARFESTVHPDAVFGIVYQVLKAEFPNMSALPVTKLPAALRNETDIAYTPHYSLVNDRLTVLVGPRVLAVGMRGGYPGWESLSRDFMRIIEQFSKADIVTRPTRYGLRYISFFPFDIYPKLRLRVTVDNEPLEGAETFFKTIITQENCRCLVQVGKDLALVGQPMHQGSIIDIDTYTLDVGADFLASFAKFLQTAHQLEKQLFFRLLTEEFLETLSPIYEHED